MYALVVRFDVLPDRLTDFDRLVAETVDQITAHEPGTLTYVSTGVEGDDAARVFIEIYRDEEAFTSHEAQPHTQRFLIEREPMLASMRVERLRPVDPA